MYLGSSDLMPRNLIARVETLFPILDPDMMAAIRDNILNICLNDNVKARVLQPDGTYVLRKRKSGEKKLRSQEWFMEHKGAWHA
jgi:polyphosphate kinase